MNEQLFGLPVIIDMDKYFNEGDSTPGLNRYEERPQLLSEYK